MTAGRCNDADGLTNDDANGHWGFGYRLRSSGEKEREKLLNQFLDHLDADFFEVKTVTAMRALAW